MNLATITAITADLDAAVERVRQLREDRAQALIAACPYKPGDEFQTGGMSYKVMSLAPGAKGAVVYLICCYRTASKQWSKGTKAISHHIEEEVPA